MRHEADFDRLRGAGTAAFRHSLPRTGQSGDGPEGVGRKTFLSLPARLAPKTGAGWLLTGGFSQPTRKKRPLEKG